ncbi:MAG TPA: hypothetical protein VFQ77_18760 [Pseudonocardiaceae bacterium]|nr:hypothetical protein [Pseudonocardiaceae bacterium]
MPFPAPRRQVDLLGEQLAAQGFVDDEHRHLFFQTLEYYQELLDNVAARLSSIGYEPTARVKTTSTLVEKLRREQKIKLSRIQDVAGARIVVGRLRTQQDQAVAEICELFTGLPREPRVIDRRADPKHGYRAVHVIAYPEGVPVEVQIRTILQDMWAQIFENLADQWGRQIRYGGTPDLPSEPISWSLGPLDLGKVTRLQILDFMKRLSEDIDHYESAITLLASAEENLMITMSIFKDVSEKIQDNRAGSTHSAITRESYHQIRRICINFLRRCEPDKRKRCRLIRRNVPCCPEPNASDCRSVAGYTISRVEEWVANRRSSLARQEGIMEGTLAILARMVGGAV